MTDQNVPDAQSMAQMRADLHEMARLLREGGHLEPQAQRSLAGLLEELGSELDSAAVPSQHTAHLAETISHVARSLHEKRQPTLIAAARDRLQEAATWAEAEAPVATGIVRRFIDVLASIGI